MSIKLRIIDKNTERSVTVDDNDLLMNVIRDDKFYIEAPCGGNGKCRKCIVNVSGVGDVLSCLTRAGDVAGIANDEEILVRIPDRGGAIIKSLGVLPDYFLNPIVELKSIRMPAPLVSDQEPDDLRLSKAASASVSPVLLPNLAMTLRDNDFAVDCLIRRDLNEIIRLTPYESKTPVLGVSIDIGTTTISASLFDLFTGEHIKTSGNLNPQKSFGADVISRIDFACESAINRKILQDIILDELILLIKKLTANPHEVQVISIAGNTTMMHLLCGYNPAMIARSPFIPVTVKEQIRLFADLFPNKCDMDQFNPLCMLLPSISGYVGADISAGILACDLDRSKRTSVMIDIGTNGEIALSADGKIVACSTAAGPAFEGANITCGIGGITGALDKIVYENGRLDFTTIGDVKPIGICGSGIISMVAAFLDAGIIDETGRFCEEPENLSPDIAAGFTQVNGNDAYAITYDSEGTPEIFMTQKDIREIQNAKAAICAGIRLLIIRSGRQPREVDDVFIAGGFGNYMSIPDAFKIGLLPPELRGKAQAVGNSAAAGATLCMLDYERFKRCKDIAMITRYYELSSDREFTDLYIDAMMFE